MIKGAKKALIWFAVIPIWLLVAARAELAVNEPPVKGEPLSSFELAVPKDAAARNYLGLSGPGQFTIPQINARVVIIHIFSMYCPVCQTEALRVNELYRLIQERKDLKDKIKLIGIGTGDTPFEVGFFRKKYKVPFPLFSDENLSVHRALGKLRTPYFIGVSINNDGSTEIFYSKLGGFKDASKFLDVILELSGLT